MGVSTCCCGSPGARMPWQLVGVLCCLICLAAATTTAQAATNGSGLFQEGIDRLQVGPEAQLQQHSPLASVPQLEGTAEGLDERPHDSSSSSSRVVCYGSSRRSSSKRSARISNSSSRQQAAAIEKGLVRVCCATFLSSGSRQLTRHLLPLWGQSEAYVPLLVCAPSIPAGDDGFPSSSQWPAKEALQADDLLYQILARKTVRVAGLGRGTGNSLSLPSKGVGGDYTTDPPIACPSQVGWKYGVSLKAEYIFFPSVETAQAAVAAGLADVTDVYFLQAHNNDKLTPKQLGGLALNTSNPLSFLYMTCPVVGAAVFVYTAHQEVSSFEDIVYFLSKAQVELETNGEKPHGPTSKITVIAASQELKKTIAPVLPSCTVIEVEENAKKALQAVAVGDALAAFFLGATAPSSVPQGVYLNGGADIILAKGAWIRRSVTTKCLQREHANDLRQD
ncbi:hypothetical protein Emed_001191 [Eimeria media]